MIRKGPYRVDEGVKKPRSLAERIATIRKAWGWTQADLAARLRVRTASVSAWERGVAVPNGISLIALGAVLNTTPEALLGESRFTIPSMLEGVAESDWRNQRLPTPTDPSRVLVVENGSATGAVKPSQLRGLVEKALGEERPVWLVIG